MADGGRVDFPEIGEGGRRTAGAPASLRPVGMTRGRVALPRTVADGGRVDSPEIGEGGSAHRRSPRFATSGRDDKGEGGASMKSG